MGLLPPAGSDDWLGLTAEPLSVHAAMGWASRPDCGAVVVFCGNVRDHAPGRPGVTSLEYEAYEEEAVTRLGTIAAGARARWTDLGRLVLHHRTGRLSVGETSVVVVASAAHRAGAFEAARWCIDTVKATLPVWKRETWAGGEDWSECSHPVEQPGSALTVDSGGKA